MVTRTGNSHGVKNSLPDCFCPGLAAVGLFDFHTSHIR